MRQLRSELLVGLCCLGGATAGAAAAAVLPAPWRFFLLLLVLAAAWRSYLRTARFALRLARTSTVDPLTGLNNRRDLERRLEDEAARSARYGGGFAVCVLDLDNFKAFNDRYGHLEGDRRLRVTASVLRRTVRGTDLAFRYGGEEFVLLLPHCGALAAAEVAERALEALRVAGVTASVGVAEFSDPSGPPRAVLAEADAACLRAKAAGKNRVVCRPPLRRPLAGSIPDSAHGGH